MALPKEITMQVDELIDSIKEFDGSKADLAEYICFEVINWASDTLYEGVGICEIVKLRFREMVEDCMEEDCICDDCKAEQENSEEEKED